MSKWITFLESPRPGLKTNVWEVCPINPPLGSVGQVKWLSRWRRYCFFPEEGTVFEQDCLRDIAAFVEEKTRAHKSA